MRFQYFFLLYFIVIQAITAQSDSIQVLEIPAIYPTDNYMINSLGKGGILLSKAEKSPVLSRKNDWKFIKLDTNFNYLDSTIVEVSPKLYLVGRTQNKSKIYSLFYNYKRDEFEVLELETKTLTSKIYQLFGIKKLLISGFAVVNGSCFVTGTLRRMPMILHFDLKAKNPRIKALSASMTRKSKLSAMSVNRKKQEIYLAIMHQKHKHFALKIKTFDLQTAEIKDEYTVYDKKSPIILDAKFKVSGDKHIFTGLYSRTFRNLPEGFFIAEFENNKQNYFKFHKFSELDNFFKYLPERQETKIKKQQEIDENYSRPMRALIRRPMIFDDKIMIVGEAYYPIYRQDNPLDQFNTWRTPVRAGSVLEGFIYTHGFAVALDKNGEQIWDNSIKYNYLKYRRLNSVSSLKKRDNKLLFYYGWESKFYASEFKENETPTVYPVQRMPVKYPKDKIRKSFHESIFNWYGNYFLATGYRTLRNSENEDDKGKRDVFYLAKFKF